jgi:CDP-diacylglycerol--glycerol-3-phosphate 3-phosphatidyltransferase
MFRQIPNALTVLRLLLAFVFFAMLSWYQYEGRGDPTFLNIAFVIYLIALVTDFLDGYLARRWKVEGQFGRISDPFVDKILVLGSFIFFAGKNFIIPLQVSGFMPSYVVQTITGVAPFMVVILLARELLVTAIRSVAEGDGKKFGAEFGGKVKMVMQSITILVILAYVNYLNVISSSGWLKQATWIRDGFIWATILVTVLSGVDYVRRAVRLMRTP